MKMKYESPVMEVFSFDVQDVVMDSSCTAYSGAGGPGGICPVDGIGCIMDTISCIVDGPIDLSSF